MTGYVYMTASQKRGTIYIGVSNSLARRLPEHKAGRGSRFTAKYGVQRLVTGNPDWNELVIGLGWD